MKSTSYIVDRVLHWLSAFLLLFMLMNLSTQLHNVNWEIKGQLEHRQDAVEMHAVLRWFYLPLLDLFSLTFPKRKFQELSQKVESTPYLLSLLISRCTSAYFHSRLQALH